MNRLRSLRACFIIGGSMVAQASRLWFSKLAGRPPAGRLRHPSLSKHALKSHRSRAGFNLIEVVIALAVASIGFIAILGMLPVGLTAARSAADSTMAGLIAQDLLANLRAQPYSDLDSYNNPPKNSYLFDQSGFDTNDVKGAYFLVTITVKDSTAIPTYLKAVTATVSWPALNPQEHSTIVTAIADR